MYEAFLADYSNVEEHFDQLSEELKSLETQLIALSKRRVEINSLQRDLFVQKEFLEVLIQRMNAEKSKITLKPERTIRIVDRAR